MKRFKRILFVVESAVDNRAALEQAINLAENNQAELTVLQVLEEMPSAVVKTSGNLPLATLQEAIVREEREKLERLVKSNQKNINVNLKVRKGIAFLEIIREVLQGHWELVIKSMQSESQLEWIFGSNDMHLLRKCPCPVWLLKPIETQSYCRIMAAVDFGEEDDKALKNSLNRKILEMAASLSHSEFCELHIVHVWRAYGESSFRDGFSRMTEENLKTYIEDVRCQHLQRLNGLMDELTAWIGKDAFDYVKPQIHFIKGHAQEEIPRLVEELQVDLMVMGTLARTGIPGFIIGNTAETILNHIPCSVLAIKPEGFTTPITLD